MSNIFLRLIRGLFSRPDKSFWPTKYVTLTNLSVSNRWAQYNGQIINISRQTYQIDGTNQIFCQSSTSRTFYASRRRDWSARGIPTSVDHEWQYFCELLLFSFILTLHCDANWTGHYCIVMDKSNNWHSRHWALTFLAASSFSSAQGIHWLGHLSSNIPILLLKVSFWAIEEMKTLTLIQALPINYLQNQLVIFENMQTINPSSFLIFLFFSILFFVFIHGRISTTMEHRPTASWD